MIKVKRKKMGYVGFKPTGPYDQTREYHINEEVLYDHDSWYSVRNENVGHTPTETPDENGIVWWRQGTQGGKHAYDEGEAVKQKGVNAQTIYETVRSWFFGSDNDGFKATAEAWLVSVGNQFNNWFSDAISTGIRYIYNAWFSQAQTDVANVIADAQDTADHPNYIGEDFYVYKWNKLTHSYNKTNIMVKGEGFHISKVFLSIEAMNEYAELDPRPDDDKLKENNFFLINTNDVENPDNAKLYIVQEDEHGKLVPTFLVDMSGAIGFTGKTPQISIGTVTTLATGQSATASLSPDGTDVDGNPKFMLNLAIPKGDKMNYNELTEAERRELAENILSEMDTASVETCSEAVDELI